MGVVEIITSFTCFRIQFLHLVLLFMCIILNLKKNKFVLLKSIYLLDVGYGCTFLRKF